MNTKRWVHVCFRDTQTSTIYIAGGEDDPWNELSSTEKWTLEENSWKHSANLPAPITWSSAVSSNSDKFIGYMVGGYPFYEIVDSLIYQMQKKNIYGLKRREKTWIKLNKTMKTGRSFHSLFNIPANQILGW